jgi:hypothetical protein
MSGVCCPDRGSDPGNARRHTNLSAARFSVWVTSSADGELARSPFYDRAPTPFRIALLELLELWPHLFGKKADRV